MNENDFENHGFLSFNFVTSLAEALVRDAKNEGINLDPRKPTHDVIIDYLNINRRLLPAVKWQVEVSKEFDCPERYQESFNTIKSILESGGDITPYMGRYITENDFNDLILNDWGIYHFHLGNEFLPNGLIKGTFELLYAYVDKQKQVVCCLQIFDHKSWAKKEALEILYNNWPELIKNFVAPTGMQLTEKISDEKRKLLRDKCVNTAIELDNGVLLWAPGLGYTSSGLSTRVLMSADKIFNSLQLWNIGLDPSQDEPGYHKLLSDNLGKIFGDFETISINLVEIHPLVFIHKQNTNDTWATLEWVIRTDRTGPISTFISLKTDNTCVISYDIEDALP